MSHSIRSMFRVLGIYSIANQPKWAGLALLDSMLSTFFHNDNQCPTNQLGSFETQIRNEFWTMYSKSLWCSVCYVHAAMLTAMVDGLHSTPLDYQSRRHNNNNSTYRLFQKPMKKNLERAMPLLHPCLLRPSSSNEETKAKSCIIAIIVLML